MWTYLSVAAVLGVLAIAEIIDQRRQYGLLAAIVVGAFAALRYETGFDWLAYEAHFTRLPGLVQYFQQPLHPYSDDLEIGYIWLNVLVKTFTDNVHVLFFIVSVATVSAIHFVISRITQRTALVWLVYFGLLFLSAQLTMVRQNVAACIVLISLLIAVRGYIVYATLGILSALAFHLSAFLYLVLPFLARYRAPAWFSAAFVGAGVLVMALGPNFYPTVLLAVEPFVPAELALKLRFYAEAANTDISLVSVILALAHGMLLVLLYLLPSAEERNDPVLKIALWLLLVQLGSQLYLSSASDLWARTMLVVTPWSVVALFRLAWVAALPSPVQIAGAVSTTAAAMACLTYLLVAPTSAPLLPYHSIVRVWLGDAGDGRERAIAAWIRDHPDKVMVEAVLAEYRRLGIYPKKVE